MKENILNEINEIRAEMGLTIINEQEFIISEIENMDLENLSEGWWENAKYAMSKLGRYKAGGKIFGKKGTDAKATEKIKALVDKKGNEMIKDLDTSIKSKNPEFPNNKSQETFLATIMEIATVYDSIVAATKVKPTDKGFIPSDAANILIEDLREYTKKYLDVDLKAAFSVFNEGEGLVDKEPNDITVLDYGDPHKTKDGYIDNPIPKGAGFAEEPKNVNEDKSKVTDKFADTKAAISKGDLEAFDSKRINTLKSWRLPLTLLGTGASFGALSWLVEYMWGPKEIITQSPEEIKSTTQEVLGNIKPGQGMTQIFNETLGTNLSASSNPTEVVDAISKIGGGDASKGVEIITQDGGIFKDPSAAKETLTELVKNPTANGDTLGDVFKGNWAGTGAKPADTLVTHTGGTLSGMVIKMVTKFVVRRTVVGGAKAAIAAPILKTLGIGLIAGALVVKLARYKGKKSSRAQILNDLIQFLRPVDLVSNTEEPKDEEPKGDVTNVNKSGKDNQLYNQLKSYFKDLYNMKSQVNTDTYGDGGSGNSRKSYTGGRDVSQDLTTNSDMDDLLKLMEAIELQVINEETVDEIGLSSNHVKLFKSNIKKLTQLINVVKKFSSQDKNLSRLIDSAKSNPVTKIDIKTLLDSDGKSLKIFVSDFNKAIYSTKFKNGNDIMDQLGKVGINKLKESESIEEKSEREVSKKVLNKVYNDRREFLKGLQGFLKTMYSIFSYLIDNVKNSEEKEVSGDKGGKEQGSKGNKPKDTTQNSQEKDIQDDPSTERTGASGRSFTDIASSINEESDAPKAKLSYTNFDRHNIFTPEMMDMTMDIIKSSEDNKFKNMAYGLFDGYLYNDLLPKAQELGLGEDIENKIRGIIKAIEMVTKLTTTEHHSSNPNDKYEVRPCDGLGTPFSVWEGDVQVQCFKTKEEAQEFADKQNKEQGLTEEKVIDEKLTPEMEDGREDAIVNSTTGRIFTQLSEIMPELSLKIANAYKAEYDVSLNRVRLSAFLETVLGAMARLPKQRMVRLINKSGMDISAYNKMLKDLKKLETVNEEDTKNPQEMAMLNSANGRIFSQLAKIIPGLSIKIVNAYQKQYGEKLNRVRLGNFLETIFGAMAMLPKQRMVMLINKSGMDLTAYNKMLKDMENVEKDEKKGDVPAKQIGDKFKINEPGSFKPDNVGGYDLTGQKDSFRIGLADKAAEIISRNNDHKLDQKNMLTVMRQLIERINTKHGGNIPKK